ncbi:DNA-binding transcriptional regulator, MarR family [Micromonospora phaseoli]|uniref:DNA-binding transcriptional regulator, MarR family n=1 Tax=Micromonospora phaseoli TaxID=1144548 RepID=A0A1H6U4C9_9ACTN|nr:MarR family winged helix-turn-helix transcriptional regulator [Micromonospora phaseoli]PZV98840.1 DNA-binding MarR family transcriptional regulator [Micromonospora phaseoli]GIJ76409.1 MarR family transcriptional regulator [Micromonospora phaseoli]SEI86346.1 DNA-binding transcriptional regulator, MarR family [Micromonospora phaseoli]
MTIPLPGRPSDLMFLLSWASHALRAEHAANLAELGISPRAHCVLARARGGGLTQRQIGELCGVDKTTMVVTLDQLEATGLARRVPSPTDRRARLVEVTAAGEQVLGQAQEISARVDQNVLAALPDEEREVFLRAIRRLVDERLSGAGACGAPGSVY